MLPWIPQGRNQNNQDGGGTTPVIIIRKPTPKVTTTKTKGQAKGQKNGK
jgi:hypothetical protein